MGELLRSWAIGDVSAVAPIHSYWGRTSLVTTARGPSFILKEKSDVSRTEHECNLLFALSEVGTPVAVPIRTVDGEWYATREGKVFCLYPRLPGDVIADHYSDGAAERAKAFGSAIGLLHTCLLKCHGASGFREMRLVKRVREWALPWIRAHGDVIDGGAIERIWGEVEEEWGLLYDELPRQLIHRDLNPANMLFDRGKLTGFVDFDRVVSGPRIFDVCYCGSSILVGGFRDAAKVEQWPGLFRMLVQGYDEMCPLTPPEHRALYGTLVVIELLFIAFSLETGAGEAARCNENVTVWLSANRELYVPPPQPGRL